MSGLLPYLRPSIRSLARAPGFAVTAIVTLTLGIGLSTAVFTVTEALLLRSLPVGDQDRVITLWGETRAGGWSNLPLTLDEVREFERGTRTLEDIGFFTFRGASPAPMRDTDRAFQLNLALVSGNFFGVLRSSAALGRALEPADDVPGAAPVIVLSHRGWQQRFGGDSAVIGRTVWVIQTGQSMRVAGVMPRGLDYPRGTEGWVPVVAYSAAGGFLETATGELDMVARLRPGASTAAARDELTSFFARSQMPAWKRGAGGVAHPFQEVVLGDTRPALILVSFAAALLLLTACVNVASLLLVRALERVRDIVVRSALGASRISLVGQHLVESALLSIIGGVLGVGLAALVIRAFVQLAPTSLPRLEEIGLDGTALIAALMITLVAMLLTGLGPTFFSSRFDPQDVLRAGSHHTSGRRVRLTAEGLVIAQIALGATSLAAAGLMGRSLIKLLQADLAFEANDLLVTEIAVRGDQFSDTKKVFASLERLESELEQVPGVAAVSPVLNVPFIGANGGIDGPLSLPGQTREDVATNPVVNIEVVAPDYFEMLQIPVRGRGFSAYDRDGGPPVVIISNSVARSYWPDGDAIDKLIAIPGGGTATVIGVVPDTRYREFLSARPSVYFVLGGNSPFGSMLPTTLLIRTEIAGASVIPALRRVLGEGTGLTPMSLLPLDDLLDLQHSQPRLHAIVLTMFAVTSVSLAAIGLFAIIATLVRQRTREIAIRMALGATAGNVRRILMARGLGLAAIGVTIGVVGALATGRLLSGLLFEIQPTDRATLVLVSGLMIVIAGFATWLPARSGMRIEPAIALRNDSV